MNQDPNQSEQRSCKEVLFDDQRGPLVLNLRKALRHPISFLRAGSFFITAHHPPCGHFDDHVLTFRGRKWCIGCTFNTISFITAMIFLGVVWILAPLLLDRFYLFWGGVGIVVVSFLMSVFGLTENKGIKVISKLMLGSAFAGVVWSVLLGAGGLTGENLPGKFLIILFLYSFIMIFLTAKHGWEFMKTCNDCEYKMRWSRCPGFGENLCKLIDSGFLQPEAPKK